MRSSYSLESGKTFEGVICCRWKEQTRDDAGRGFGMPD
jgi:hypothetical protein